MVVARGTRKVDIWYLDPQDARQRVVIEGNEGSYEIAEGVVRVYRGDRTLIVPLSRVVLIDERLD